MAEKSNRARVGEAMELLATGLYPFVDRVMTGVYKKKNVDWAAEFHRNSRNAHHDFNRHDPTFLLDVMIESWDPYFRQRLPNGVRNRLFTLKAARNDWAHNKAFKATDTQEALLSVINLLEAVDATEVEEVQASLDELLRSMYASAEVAAASADSNVLDAPVKNLRPWRQVIAPHEDVRSGQFNVAEFAADLELVRRGEAGAEYGDPALFFERTFLTAGLRQLLGTALDRITGGSGQPVINCQTNFGGGKTHSLIALYHLFSGRPLGQLPEELRRLADDHGVDELPAVQRAVVVGNRFAPGDSHPKPDGTVVNTVWGEIAWQLGGADGYAVVAASDQSRTNPGDALRTLLAACSPCLILIDEWVAYARELYGRDDLQGGSFESQFSFAQALTEAVRATPGCLFVVSIPASEGISDVSADGAVSDIEVGGPAGREALKRLTAVVTRQAEHWQPATSDESFEIVRRRLFEPLAADNEASRDETAQAFGQLYRANRGEFPPECAELRYVDRIRSAYPIHPELFDRLYQAWSTVERFQRTRGVLRLMAAVIHALWTSEDQSPLIMPCSVPLDHPRVIGELTGKLDDHWRPVIDSDVEGPSAKPAQIDRAVPHLGAHHASRRVARTIFLGATPTVKSPNRGLETERVKLGAVFATEKPAAFVLDALNRLMQQSSHLYVANNRYWFDLQENVSRTARDEATRLMAGDRHEIHTEIVKRLKAMRGDGSFRRVHVAPLSSSDVADDPRCGLVVLGPDAPHIAKSQDDSPAQVAAREILDRRGNSPRMFRNMLVFAACDQRALEALEHATADYLAWYDICERAKELNLDKHNEIRAENSRDAASDAVRVRLDDAYAWAVVPHQDRGEPPGPIALEEARTDSQGSIAERVSRKLASDGSLQTQFPPLMLRQRLDTELAKLWEGGHVAVNELWDAFAKHVYLPRLADIDVLVATVASGADSMMRETEGFAVADTYDEASGRYGGLTTEGRHSGTSPTTLVVRPAVASKQTEVPGDKNDDEGLGGEGSGTTVVTPPPGDDRGSPTHFAGKVTLSSERYARDFGLVSEEILNHLAGKPGTEVTIRVEIEANRPDGFDDATVRNLTENARQLKFESDSGFSGGS